MKKNILLIGLCAVVITGFTKENSFFFTESKQARYNLHKENAIFTVSKSVEPFEIYYTPTVDNQYIGFKEALGFKESRGNYKKVNTLGYLGKYQFGPKLQEEAFYALCSLNKWILIRDIKRSVGRKINGVEITESGILAAAHLAGAGNVKKYLRSNGELNSMDAYGTDVQLYMKRFAGYDTSFIKPEKNACI
jgi:hypothetical protein